MAKADVLALVDLLAGTRSDSASLATTATRDAYYGEAVAEHGLIREGAMNAEFVAVARGTATYNFPDDAVRVLAWVFDAVTLRPTNRRALEAYDSEWRARKGTPQSYTMQDEDARTVRLVPVPNANGMDLGSSTPFDGAFPDGNLTAIYTDGGEDHPVWDELWLALEVLSREFARDSDHMDMEYATAASQLASVVRILVGYSVPDKDGR
jgi:hypothetical protein